MDFDNFPVDVIWQLSGSLFCWIFEEGGPLISISLEKSKIPMILEHISKYTYEHWFQTKIVSRRFSFQCLIKIRDPAGDTFFFYHLLNSPSTLSMDWWKLIVCFTRNKEDPLHSTNTLWTFLNYFVQKVSLH